MKSVIANDYIVNRFWAKRIFAQQRRHSSFFDVTGAVLVAEIR